MEISQPCRYGRLAALSASLVLLLLFMVVSCISFLSSSDDSFSWLPFNLTHPFIPASSQLETPFLRTQLSFITNEVHAAQLGDEDQVTSPTHIIKVGKLSYAQKLELGLAKSRLAIRKASKQPPLTAEDAPRGSVYRNPGAFYRSYLEMEKRFKVHVYEEGSRPIVHDGPWKNIYTSEGRFIQEMESEESRFKISDPRRAHVHFMPFSVAMMVKFLYDPNSDFDKSPLLRFTSDYIRVISTKYPFWNRTQGADHFMLACHDWGPDASSANPLLHNISIRVLCNANTSEGFNPRKDVSLPEINLLHGNISPDLLSIPENINSSGRHLAFFAGGVHGPIRPILLQHWFNRDSLLPIFEYLPSNLSYYAFMLDSKFCLCPSGYEVASPRIVEAIYAECVPVIISQHYVLPFSDVLQWEAFSLQVDISDIPHLKHILSSIPEERYMRLKKGVRAVKKHFMFNQPPKRFDVFHMILHSIWLRRLNLKLL